MRPPSPKVEVAIVDKDDMRLDAGAVAFRELSATAAGGRHVLSEVSALVPSGALCAVMGPSGSGKTTLIKALCGVTTGLTIAGEAAVVLGDDIEKGVSSSRTVLGYVSQEDQLLPLLSVREALAFTARLRGVPPKTVTAVVRRLLEGNGLQACAETRIGGGDSGLRGISGGERRRVSLAVGLLEEPAVLCADEVTSGLDASSAHQIVQLLRQQADSGTTVLCSIHQPREEIFQVFTHLVLVSAGRLVYAGTASHALRCVEQSIGFCCPAFQNSADFIIDVCALDHTGPLQFEESVSRVQLLADDQDRRSTHSGQAGMVSAVLSSGESLLRDQYQKRKCFGGYVWFGTQVTILTRRAVVLIYRDRLQWISAAYQSALFGFVLGYANYMLGTATYDEISSRVALCYMAPGIVGYNIQSANLYLYCQRMPLFDAEWFRDGMYSPAALVVSQFLATIPLTLIAPLALFLPTYFLAGLDLENPWAPLGFFLSLMLTRIICTTIALFLVCLEPTRSYGKMSVVANAVGILSSFTSTFLQPLSLLPDYISWFRYVSYNFYSYRLTVSSQFSEFELDVGVPGTFVLDHYGVSAKDYGMPILAMLGLSCAFLVGSVIGLMALKPHPPVIKDFALAIAQKPPVEALDLGMRSRSDIWQPDVAAGSSGVGPSVRSFHTQISRSMTEALDAACVPAAETDNGLSVILCDVSLEVQQPRTMGASQPPPTPILDKVTVHFEPGTLTAVLGPSGAGKTTLLSVISGQVGDSGKCAIRKSTVHLTGRILLGEHPTTRAELMSNVAGVGQHDHHMPGLTVEEALRYAARLRLPYATNAKRKRRIARLVKNLGLNGCLRTVIGLQSSGGISGGERRRLSVAMACLSHPRVLVLDEPSTGLDALAAHQLISLLSKLSRERGMTVVSTIHQPRSDLVPLFDGVVLMGPGGRVLFTGPPKNLQDHALASSIEPPETGNILDFAVDVSRITQQAQAFHETWARQIAEEAEESVWQIPVEDHRELEPLQRCPAWLAFRVNFARSVRNLSRQPEMVWPRCSNFILLGAILVLVYAPLDDSQDAIRSRLGLLHMTLGALFAGTLNNLAIFPTERDVFFRESADRLYSALPFLAAYTSLEVCMELLTSALGGLLVIYVTGLENSVEALGTYMFMGFVCQFNGESIGIALNVVVSNAGFSVNAINAVCTIVQVISGFLATSLPPLLEYVNFASPIYYGAEAMALTQFPSNKSFNCSPSDGFCMVNGQEVLDSIGFDGVSLGFNIGMALLLSVAYRVASFFLLRSKSGRASVGAW